MEIIDQFVEWDHCKTCLYFENSEHQNPCDECLTYPVNQNTDKPLRWAPIDSALKTNP